MRLLLVEDDRDVAEYLRKGLEEEGYSVKLCFDGASGFKAAELSAFDIIVLDVMLPFALEVCSVRSDTPFISQRCREYLKQQQQPVEQ